MKVPKRLPNRCVHFDLTSNHCKINEKHCSSPDTCKEYFLSREKYEAELAYRKQRKTKSKKISPKIVEVAFPSNRDMKVRAHTGYRGKKSLPNVIGSRFYNNIYINGKRR